MSGDLTSVQGQLVINEFVDNLKTLSVSNSSNSNVDVIKELQVQLKSAIPNGFSKNKPFAFTIIDNLYRAVPYFDAILSNEDDHNDDYIQTKLFLQSLADAFNAVCLFDVFTILKDTSRLQVIFQNYIGLLKENYFIDNDKYDTLLRCLLPIVAFSSVLVSFTEEKIPANLLGYLLTFVKRNWQCQHRELVVGNILGLIKCFSKKPTLIPMIIRKEWPHACIEWLTNTNTENHSRPKFLIDYLICLILQKLARHTTGVQILNQLNCLKALDGSKEQMHKDHTETECNYLHVLRCMIYALLMEADEIKQLTKVKDSQICQVLDQLVVYTIQASNAEYLFYECFHISELLSVLSKLFVNDDILTKCMNGNAQLFDCLCQLVIHFANITGDINRVHQPTDDETLLSLTNLLWSISFHQCYHDKFQTNSLLMHTLSNLATSASLYTGTQTKSIPRDLCSLKKAAEGVLWNLKSSSSLSRSVSKISNEKTEEQQPLAMISYSHSDSVFCRELVERLSAHVPVWVDYKQADNAIAHSDDLWEEIARAMEMATIIVLIVSKEYYDSKSCRQELSYASDTLKKRIVPIYAPNQQYRASGWLGIRIAGQKYIHFGRKLFSDAIQELSSMIITDQKSLVITSVPPTLPPPSSPSPSVPPSSLETTPVKIPEEEEHKLLTLQDWTPKDIQKWFDDNHIHKNLITLYADRFHTGTALIVYAHHLKLFYQNEYIRIYAKYYKMFHEKNLDTLDFITFVDALYRLHTEYDPNSNAEDYCEKDGYQQSRCKVKSSQEEETIWL